jgi:hypothetical protein
VFFTTIGFGALMPAVVKYLKKLEHPHRHAEESSPSHSINQFDEESNLERYSIQRYDSTSNSDK